MFYLPNSEKRVKNTTRKGVFLTKFEVFGQPMKHCLECLIYLLNRNKIQGVNREVKSSKSILVKTGIQTSFTVVVFSFKKLLLNY